MTTRQEKRFLAVGCALAAVLGMFLVFPPASLAAENLLSNGDFEAGEQGWTLAGNAKVISDASVGPAKCVELKYTDSGPATLTHKGPFKFEKGWAYRLSGKIRYRDLLASPTIRITYQGVAQEFNPLGEMGHHITWWTGTAEWELFYMDLFPPEAAGGITQIKIANEGDAIYNPTSFWGSTPRGAVREICKVKEECLWLDDLKLERRDVPNRMLKPVKGSPWRKTPESVNLDEARSLAEETRISDEVFFGLLNLDYKGLEEVKGAIGTKDYKKAREALKAYWERDKKAFLYPSNRWVEFPRPAAGSDVKRFEGRIKEAQAAVKKIEDSKSLSPNEANGVLYYVALAMWNARDYSAVTPAFNQAMRCVLAIRNLSDLHVNTCNGHNHDFTTFMCAAESGRLETDVFTSGLKFFVEYANALLRECHPAHKVGNWLTEWNRGLLLAAIYLPEFKDAPVWRDAAVERIRTDVLCDLLDDGAQIELATVYMDIVAGNHWATLQMAEGGKVDLGDEVRKKVELEFQHLLALIQPNWLLPALNDSYIHTGIWGEGGDTSKGASSFTFPGKGFLIEARGAEPPYKSVGLPYSGRYVMRSGWGQEALYLVFDASPLGKSHNQDDKLTFKLHAYGVSLIEDPGRSKYGTWHTYGYAWTQGHNCILVDGHGQRGHAFPHDYIGRVRQPAANWAATSAFDYAEGIYNRGFRYKSAPYAQTDFKDKELWKALVTHTRAVFFAKPDYWIIADRMAGDDGHAGEHTFERLFLCGAGGRPDGIELADGSSKTLKDKKRMFIQAEYKDNRGVAHEGSLELVPARPDSIDSVEVYKGVDRPEEFFARGWIDDGTAYQIGIFRKCKVPVNFVTVLYPHPKKDVQPTGVKVKPLAEQEDPDSDGAEIERGDAKDFFIVSFDALKKAVQGPLSLTGRAGLVRTKGGKPASAFLVRGKSLDGAGVSVSASPEATVSFAQQGGKWVAENGSNFPVDVDLKVNGATVLKEKLPAGPLMTLPEIIR